MTEEWRNREHVTTPGKYSFFPQCYVNLGCRGRTIPLSALKPPGLILFGDIKMASFPVPRRSHSRLFSRKHHWCFTRHFHLFFLTKVGVNCAETRSKCCSCLCTKSEAAKTFSFVLVIWSSPAFMPAVAFSCSPCSLANNISTITDNDNSKKRGKGGAYSYTSDYRRGDKTDEDIGV